MICPHAQIAAWLCVYLVAVAGPMVWFLSPASTEIKGIRLNVARELKDFKFENQSLTESVLETLATTNIVNGQFTDRNRVTITVFQSNWDKEGTQGLVPLQHTPDVCWPGLGWMSVNAGQPTAIEVKVNGGELSFECRVFEHGPNRHRSLVLWCTIVNGRIVPESMPVRSATTNSFNTEAGGGDRHSRALAAGHFLWALRTRTKAAGSKQFVRVSMEMKDDWRMTFEKLEQFCLQWIRVVPITQSARLL